MAQEGTCIVRCTPESLEAVSLSGFTTGFETSSTFPFCSRQTPFSERKYKACFPELFV